MFGIEISIGGTGKVASLSARRTADFAVGVYTVTYLYALLGDGIMSLNHKSNNNIAPKVNIVPIEA